MENKKTIILDRKASDMAFRYHHLIIDQKSLGPENWQMIAAAIAEYLQVK